MLFIAFLTRYECMECALCHIEPADALLNMFGWYHSALIACMISFAIWCLPAVAPTAGLIMPPQRSAPPLLQAKPKAATMHKAVHKQLGKRKQPARWNANNWAWADDDNKWEDKAWDDRPWRSQQWKGQVSQGLDWNEQWKDQSWQGKQETKREAKQAKHGTNSRTWSYTYLGGKWNGTLPQVPAANKVLLTQVDMAWDEAAVCDAVTMAAAPPRFMLPAKRSSPHHQAWVVAFTKPAEAADMLQAKSLPQGWLVIPYKHKAGQHHVSSAAQAVAAETEVEAEVIDVDVDAVAEEAEVEEAEAQEAEGAIAELPIAMPKLTWLLTTSRPGQQVTFIPIGLQQLPPEAQHEWTALTRQQICSQVCTLAPEYTPSQCQLICAMDCRPAIPPKLMPIKSGVHSGWHSKAVLNILADSRRCVPVLLQLPKAWKGMTRADHKVVALVDTSSGHEAVSWARILAAVCRQLGYGAHMDNKLVHQSFLHCMKTCPTAETAGHMFLDEVLQAVNNWSAVLLANGQACRLEP